MSLRCLAFVQVAILVNVALAIRAADYVEIAVELKSTWTSQSKTNHHSRTARCVVGTNDWYIAGNFLENAEAHYWLIGTNVIERRIITSSMYLRQAEDFVSERILRRKPTSPMPMAGSYPHAGEKSTTVHPSPRDNQPARERRMRSGWFSVPEHI